jgi:hypothetical protein
MDGKMDILGYGFCKEDDAEMPEELARKAHMHAHQHKSHRQEYFSFRIEPFTILSASTS